jgi:small-conductance mechanosensitive channel
MLLAEHKNWKAIVNFILISVNDLDALRRRRDEEQSAAQWQSRLQQLQRDVDDNWTEMSAALSQAENCYQLWQQVQQECQGSAESEDNSVRDNSVEDKAVVDALIDQHRELSRRWLPLAKKWIGVLTKAGRRTDSQLLRQDKFEI